MKKRLLIYSDCYTFSGSENVILNLLSSEHLKENYDMNFLYRHSRNYSDKMKKVFNKNKLDGAYAVYLKRFSDVYYNSNYSSFLRIFFYKIDEIFDFLLLYYIYWIPFFVRKIKSTRPDVIHINNGGYPAASSCLAFAIAARICRVRKVIMHVNNLAAPRKWNAFTYKVVDHYIKKSVTCFVTGSKAAASVLQHRRGFAGEQIININNTLLRDYKEQDGQELLLHKSPSEIWIGYVGLLTQRKGVDVLIKAASILKKDLQQFNAKIIIVGDGEEEQNLKKTVLENKLQDIVVFTGYRSNAEAYMKLFELFVLPSIANEDFPYVLLEAMKMAKPVISTKIAGIPEIVEHEHTGFIIAPKSATDLADKINFLLCNAHTRQVMGKRGADRYNSLFSYEKTMEKFGSLYDF